MVVWSALLRPTPQNYGRGAGRTEEWSEEKRSKLKKIRKEKTEEGIEKKEKSKSPQQNRSRTGKKSGDKKCQNKQWRLVYESTGMEIPVTDLGTDHFRKRRISPEIAFPKTSK